MHPKDLSIKDLTYELPPERIAKYPLPVRDTSKLLIWKKGKITEDTYANLADHLPANSLLIFNNTKVVEARLLFQKNNGSNIEIFCLEPGDQYADITTAMLQKEKVLWKCLVGGAKKWKEGALHLSISKDNETIILTAKKIEQLSDAYLIELSWDRKDLSFAEILHLAGLIPLPPYLNRSPEETDKERYQTIYAKHDGSVAAPTAGLHFTGSLFENLKRKISIMILLRCMLGPALSNP
jgi:S-adenosylmethionine:tRNA ribosyltransferase-isomerase